MPKIKKPFVDCEAVKQAVSIVLVLDYGFTDHFNRSGDSVTEPCSLRDGAGPTHFGVSISKNWWNGFSECENGDTYAAKYVPIGYRTPSPEELRTRRIARDLKLPTGEAIAIAAPAMAALIDGPCWLVPVPASDGSLIANLVLAHAIADLVAGARVKCAVGRAHAVESCCHRRLRGLPGLTVDQHAIIRAASPMQLLPVYFVDNVITTGTTVAACRRALGWGTGLAYADASTPRNTHRWELPQTTEPRVKGQFLQEAAGAWPMNNLPLHDLRQKEWEAWQNVVGEWHGDINDPRVSRLVNAIHLWGEWLTRLRGEQTPDLRQSALAKAQAAYEKTKQSDPPLCDRSSVRSRDRLTT